MKFGQASVWMTEFYTSKDYDPNAERPADVVAAAISWTMKRMEADADHAHGVGRQEGYDAAVQHIDWLTGGDGEYRVSPDPDRNIPDSKTMTNKIVARFEGKDFQVALAVEKEKLQTRKQAQKADRYLADLIRADSIIGWMSEHIGNMCPPKQGLADLNAHWLDMESNKASVDAFMRGGEA